MMEGVKRGGNRQELHEIIRVHSHAAAAKVKLEGGANDLIERMANDERIPLSLDEINAQLDPNKYVGRSASQVTEFLRDVVNPILERYNTADVKSELNL